MYFSVFWLVLFVVWETKAFQESKAVTDVMDKQVISSTFNISIIFIYYYAHVLYFRMAMYLNRHPA